MIARLLSTALVTALTAPAARPQDTLEPGAPADVGMSEAVLRAGASLFEEAVLNGDLKGVVVLVARRGKVVLHEAFGFRDAAREKPMAKDSLFRLASNTKPVIATAILQLVEGGKLALDDNVRKHLPSFDNHRAAFITVRQLLSHTGGLRIRPIFLKPLIQESDAHPDAPSLQAEVARFGAIGADVLPGTSYSYSNPGYNTLGALIEVASSLPLKDYLRERIYAPLGMTDSCNHEPDADPSRMSEVFRRDRRNGRWRQGWKPGDPPDYPFPRASGGMISTALDYAVFCQTFLQSGTYGGKKILGSDSVAAATRSQTEGVAGGASYGFGWSIAADGTFSHGGSDGTWAWVDPHREIVGIVFTQSPGGRNPRAQFKRVVEAACYDGR